MSWAFFRAEAFFTNELGLFFDGHRFSKNRFFVKLRSLTENRFSKIRFFVKIRSLAENRFSKIGLFEKPLESAAASSYRFPSKIYFL